MTERLFILGAGRAGLGLARALRAVGVEVIGVHGRREGMEGVTWGALPTAASEAGVILVTVRDAQIDEALRELASAPLAVGAVILHASGSAEPLALGALRRLGHPSGTFHPLVPLSDPARAPAMLRGAWIGIDGDEAARAAARTLAGLLGAHTLEIPAGEKARYHAAAVIASNFPAVMLSAAERVLVAAGIAPDEAAAAIRPLFMAAADNLRHQSGAASLTGPIVRGDAITVRAHLAALAGDAGALAIYRALSRAALPLAREAGTDPRALADIGRALGDG
ncbi:MAG: DUF2520 domain-containing protein [Gemmatimonadota bacterium]|nr:DUF2520 domain-containing protein [Gemmatimonadota bacterium]